MAIANSDGSIILSTKLDTSGVSKGLADIKNKFAALRDQRVTFATLTQAIKDQSYVIKQLSVEHANLVAKGKGTSAQAVELKGRIDTLTAEMKEMQAAATTLGAKTQTAFTKMKTAAMTFVSYFIGIQTIFAAIRFSGAAAEFATQTEASVQRLVDIYGEASGVVGDFIDQNARALGMSKSAAASFSSVYGNLFGVWADQATNAELTNRYLQSTAVVASKTGRTVEDVQERIRSGLLGNTEAIEDLGIFVNVKTIEITDAFQRMADGKSWEQLDAYTQQQIRAMAILEQATAKYGDEVAQTSATIRNQFNAAYQDFQNSWGNIINTVLLPVLQVLTQVMNIATAGLNALSGRTGKILEGANGIESASDKTADNINRQTKNQKALNKEIKKGLARFDEINTLSSETADNTSGSGLQSIGGDLGGNLDGSAYVDEANATLTAIMGVVSVSLIAIGILLCATGHIGWGVGFIIAGAGLLTITQASVSQEGVGIDVQNALTTALLIVGVAAIVLGIILCMCNMLGRGIALIALGAVTVVGTIAINWDSIKDMLSDEKVANWVAVGGILAIVLGILLCFAQQWWVGIGLIALGTTALGVDVAVNWNAITEAFTNGKTAKWIAIGGIVAIVLGILLCFAQQWAWGIGLIALGAATVATVVAVNWDAITTAIKDFFVENSGIIALISAGLLIIGILVCFINLPLGIALIAAGAASLVTVIALNWDAIVDWVKGAVNAVIDWVQTYGMLILGIFLVLSGIGMGYGIKIIWDWLSNSAESGNPTSKAIVDWVKGVWKAVEGFWNKYIAPVFTAKFWLDLAKTCGNGLIAGFEGAINGIIWLFESLINLVVRGLNLFIKGISTVTGAVGDLIGINLRIPEIPKASLGRVSIPRLAEGTVVPPNREFMAILGDNKTETEVVSPLSTMKQAFLEALQTAGNVGTSQDNRPIILQIDGREIARATREGNTRLGTQTVFGGFANAY